MKTTLNSSHVSVTFTSNSDFLSPKNASSVETETSPVVTTFMLDGQKMSSVSLPGGTSINDLIAQQDEETLALMRMARQELSQGLAKVQPANIRTLRLAKGWTQQELAREVGMSQAQVARLEKYQGDPCLSSIRRLADAFGVGADEIVAAWPGMKRMAEPA
jgi:DNA-binding XRE family transcriptional regulator